MLANIITVFLIAIGLAMDAFAVSVTNGITVPGFKKKHAVTEGIYFGVFQFMMPIIGWVLGTGFRRYIENYDHWIAFALLALIGGNMIFEALKNKSCPQKEEPSSAAKKLLTPQKLVMQAIATSIDALAVGVSLSVMDVSILLAAVIIGVVAFVLSVAGGMLGKKIGCLFQKRAEIIGGIVLIAIGVKILIEHTL